MRITYDEAGEIACIVLGVIIVAIVAVRLIARRRR
jgi:hypothetical protein